MAHQIIHSDTGPSRAAAAERTFAASSIEEDLTTAMAMNDLAMWVERARYFVEQVQEAAESHPGAKECLAGARVALHAADWDKAASQGLEYLHIAIWTRMNAIQRTTRLVEPSA